MGSVGIGEWMIILVILLLLFGPGRLAGLGSAAGRTIREFRKAMDGEDEPTGSKTDTTASDAKPHLTSGSS